MASVRLTEQLKRVKEVLTTWKEVDGRVPILCPSSSAAVSISTGTANACTDKITDGLVGFLSGNLSSNTWKDEYLGVNATVTGATEGKVTTTDNGLKLEGAWAEWPVGRQGENQLYHFANYNFTLVATVSIHNVPEEATRIPLMGVRLEGNGETKLLELSYDSGKKWWVLCSDGTNKKLKGTWDQQTQYQVAIVLQNGTQVSAYVDGKRVCGSVQRKLENTDSEEISYFYIGGSADNKVSEDGVSVSVKNVLLYNRPLTFSGGNADLEEDTVSPLEIGSPSMEGDQKKGPPGTKPSLASGTQATSQQTQQKSGTQKNTTVEGSATAQQGPANTSHGSVGNVTASNSHAAGEARGDDGTVGGSGLLPLLLLLGLWGVAAL
ncbi:trans-sialidase, putative [Trypanosoma cruzi marinkellei]|uniref:Trans-sialidase, putative n=1 Tax=Trypanosoma cruzi marinkellei TaxID=85056 RepID=K2M3I8_TRYCR|nr:trans-sialidase, putative [Trypanosoma cruzi marinkellei]